MHDHRKLTHSIRTWLGRTLAAAIFLAAGSAMGEMRILIVGDSWAASIATVQYDGPGFGSFDAVLAANGLGQYTTQGRYTARGGRTAEFWAKSENLATIVSELQAFPAIDIVHLIIGGNDFLGDAKEVDLHDANVRGARFLDTYNKMQTIITTCLAVRPSIRVVLADYDYLDVLLAGLFQGTTYHNATQRDFNDWLIELGQYKRVLAQTIDRCEYVQNWGTLQYWYHEPEGVAYPGGPPDYDPYPGGDLDAKMPGAAHVGDGIHPNDQAHRYMLQNAMDSFYLEWLSPDSDGDGVKDYRDNCPQIANPDQADADDNGIGDACETPEGEGTAEGIFEGEGVPEGSSEGIAEGMFEGEGVSEGIFEGAEAEGISEGIAEGAIEGEGAPEGNTEGVVEGEPLLFAQIAGGTAEGVPGSIVTVSYTVPEGGAPAAGMVFDLTYDAARLTWAGLEPSAALTAAAKRVGGVLIQPGRVRVIVSEAMKSIEPIPVGALMTAAFSIALSAPAGETLEIVGDNGTALDVSGGALGLNTGPSYILVIPGSEGEEGSTDGDGVYEGVLEEGSIEGEGVAEGVPEGEGIPEGLTEGSTEEGEPGWTGSSADQDQDWSISLAELLRVIQFFNSGGFHCDAGSEDGFAPGTGAQACAPHSSDYSPRDWRISLTELLRLIQFFNSPGHGYRLSPHTEDGFAPAGF